MSVMSRPNRIYDGHTYVSQFGGVQDKPFSRPDMVSQGNWHYWLESKIDGTIYDPSPVNEGVDLIGQPLTPLLLNGKEIKVYIPFSRKTQKTIFKKRIINIDEYADNAGISRYEYLQPFIKKSKQRLCFNNCYAKWEYDPEIRSKYHLRSGSFGYENNDETQLPPGFKSVITLDYGY